MQQPPNFPVIKSISNDIFGINFVINTKCNQRCKYCHPNFYEGRFPGILPETYINFFNNLVVDNPVIQQKAQRKITITGGEPSFYKGVEDVIKCLKSLNFLVAMNTNLGNNFDFWDRVSDTMDILYPSFHPRYANIDHFEKIINLFLKKNKFVELHVLMDPEYWDKAVEASNYFFKMDNITVNNKGILDININKKYFINTYTEDQINFIKNNPSNKKFAVKTDHIVVEWFDGRKTNLDAQEILVNNYHNFNKIFCHAGKNALNIKESGSIYGACCGMKYFGNLHETPNLRIKLNNRPVQCTKTACPHIFDMKIHKSYDFSV